jgi:hypothetical protein
MNDHGTRQYCEKPWSTGEEHADHEKACPARPGEARQCAQRTEIIEHFSMVNLGSTNLCSINLTLSLHYESNLLEPCK